MKGRGEGCEERVCGVRHLEEEVVDLVEELGDAWVVVVLGFM